MDNSGQWIRTGNEYKLFPNNSSVHDKLHPGVYMLHYDYKSSSYYLEYVSEHFIIDFKVYDIETDFIDHVYRTFQYTSRNLGILMTGKQGTGKTVTAKLLCNKMNIPVIIIPKNYPDIQEFIGSIPDECVIFFDEFEKIFEDETNVMLSVMDGVYTGKNRKVFILTTNNNNIDSNFLNRPSRIRYNKEFYSLTEPTIREYCKDNLDDPSYIDKIIDYCKTLEMVTIDILRVIVEETNIHKKDIKDISEFNTQECRYNWGIHYIKFNYPANLKANDIIKWIDIEAAKEAFKQIENNSNNDDDIDIVIKGVESSDVTNYIHYIDAKDNWAISDRGDYIQGAYPCPNGFVIYPKDKNNIMVIYDEEQGTLIYIKTYSISPCNQLRYSADYFSE